MQSEAEISGVLAVIAFYSERDRTVIQCTRSCVFVQWLLMV